MTKRTLSAIIAIAAALALIPAIATGRHGWSPYDAAKIDLR